MPQIGFTWLDPVDHAAKEARVSETHHTAPPAHEPTHRRGVDHQAGSDTERLTRRAAIASLAVGAAAAPALAALQPDRSLPGIARDPNDTARGPLTLPGYDAEAGKYVLPDLPYAADALEPHIDAETMRLHHGRHHNAYVNGLNRALDKLAGIREGHVDAGEIKFWSRELSFHGSGHVNHALFWHMMAPARERQQEPGEQLAAAIRRDFDGMSGFLKHFKAAANAVEGNGWGWLVHEPVSGRLLVLQGESQQNLMLTGARPLLGVDVWEHAYYLKYQNRRADYVEAFANVINWAFVDRLYAEATASTQPRRR